MNDCIVEREANLEHRDLADVLKDYIKENPAHENVFKIIDRMEKSCHLPLIH